VKIVQSRKVDPGILITHRFKLENILDAYETFVRAAETKSAQSYHRGVGTATCLREAEGSLWRSQAGSR